MERAREIAILRSITVPATGGDTLFANMYLAYESLTPGFRQLLEGLRGVNSAEKPDAESPDQNKGKSHRIEDLVVTDVRIDGGPMFKRIRPRARGTAFMIKKRSSHIRVGLTPIDEL